MLPLQSCSSALLGKTGWLIRVLFSRQLLLGLEEEVYAPLWMVTLGSLNRVWALLCLPWSLVPEWETLLGKLHHVLLLFASLSWVMPGSRCMIFCCSSHTVRLSGIQSSCCCLHTTRRNGEREKSSTGRIGHNCPVYKLRFTTNLTQDESLTAPDI